MPTDPNKAAADLLKNPQFLEMFQKAMGNDPIPDEKDPKRNEWLKKMQDRLREESEVEAKKKLEAVQSDDDGKWMWIQPSPGFCIKCATKKGEKVFINIGQHEKIAEPMPLDDQDAEGAEIKYRIPLSCNSARFDTDKAGKGCRVYDVIVNPNTIKRCGEDSEFRRFVAALCMTWINQKSEPDLNTDEFKNVNFKVKGKMEIQRIRLSAPAGAGNAMHDEIKLPGAANTSGSVPSAGTQLPGRKMVSEVQESASPPKATTTAASSSPAREKPSYELKPEGMYNWATHQKPAKNPYFRSSPPAKFLLDVTIPGITTIKEVEVKVLPRSVLLTYVDEEDEGPFLTIALPFPVAEDPESAKFIRKKTLLQLVLVVQLPDETADVTSGKTPASRDACEVEAEEEAAKKKAEEKEWEERKAKMERIRQGEEAIMKQRKELVEGMSAIQEGLVPPHLAEEIRIMTPEQKRHMMMRVESRQKMGDQMDILLDKLPGDALDAIGNLCRAELGLELKKVTPAAKPAPPPQPKPADNADRHLVEPTKESEKVVEYNYAKKAENLFGVTLYNRYLFALDH